MAEHRLERLKTSGQHGTQAEREANDREEAVLRRLHAGLEAGTPIRDLALDADDEKAIRGFRFLTQKPVLVLLNVGEGDLATAPELVATIAAGYATSTRWSTRCRPRSRWSSASSSPTRRRVHGGARASPSRGSDRVIALSYRLLGLVSFLTAGPGRGPRLADPGRLDGRRRGRGDPLRPRQGLHPGRDRRLRGPAQARLDGGGAEGRQAALGGQDLPGRTAT